MSKKINTVGNMSDERPIKNLDTKTAELIVEIVKKHLSSVVDKGINNEQKE